jgi:predicted transposase/invertase (TIGR01784 family)
MGRFINPFTDVGFKRIFGQEMSKPILIEFLNSLLVGERKIVDLKYLDKEQLGLSELERSLIYDIYCETETGEHIIVEMQNKYQYSFKNRSIYYVARSIVEQGQRGRQWNYDVKAVYLVAFLNFMQAEIASKFRTDVVLMDMEERTQFSDKVRLVYLQLPYFNKEAEDCKTTFDRMIYVLKNMDILERMPWAAQDSVFQKLASIAEVAALDKEERFRYDENIRAFRDNHVIMETQRMEGRKEGHEKAQQTIARNLKQMGLSLEDISKATGLTKEEIENI